MPDDVSAKTALLPPTAPDVTARSGRWHPEPAACPKALWPRGLHPSEKTHGESVRRDALTGAKSTDARQATRGVELASRPSRMNIGPGQCRLTPELSRAAKRRRLGRIVRPLHVLVTAVGLCYASARHRRLFRKSEPATCSRAGHHARL
jgi:hypothetical protein